MGGDVGKSSWYCFYTSENRLGAPGAPGVSRGSKMFLRIPDEIAANVCYYGLLGKNFQSIGKIL
jgi:hypothetical protein